MRAKRAKLASDGKNIKDLVGHPVRYLGLGDKRYCCPSCCRTFSRGFYYEEGTKNGCSRQCLEKQIS